MATQKVTANKLYVVERNHDEAIYCIVGEFNNIPSNYADGSKERRQIEFTAKQAVKVNENWPSVGVILTKKGVVRVVIF